jgi:hypothetical protein
VLATAAGDAGGVCLDGVRAGATADGVLAAIARVDAVVAGTEAVVG